MLSVIVPIYNVEQYLPQCLESICSQKYQDLEILLINDGSQDNCAEICDRYAKNDNRIKVIHKKNEGLVCARKKGLYEATGEYITFVDGDDWIESDMYLKLIKIISNTDADFIDSKYFINNCYRYDEELQDNIYIFNDKIRHAFFLSMMDMGNFVDIAPSIWSKIFKAELIKNSYKYVPDSMQYGEDTINLLYCILNAKKMIQVKATFYHYTYREDSMFHKKDASIIRKELRLWNYYGNIVMKKDKFMKQEDVDRCLFKKIYNTFYRLNSDTIDFIHYYAFSYIEQLYNKKIVLYGAGKVGKDYFIQISKYKKCNIICWVDKRYHEIQCEYCEIEDVSSFLDKFYDVVLIAIEDKEKAKNIKCFLVEKGVPEEKILWQAPILLKCVFDKKY